MASEMILQNDFKRQWQVIEKSVIQAIQRVGESGWYILGQEVQAFETELARFWGLSQAIGVANGMDALEIGLRCLGLKPGDKVLTTPLSAFATTLAILRAGGVPVFVDVDKSGLIDLQQCRGVLERDRSIRFFVPVHLYGFPIEMLELEKLKEEFELRVIEDCAQAIGASSRRVRAGAVGQIAATSFYPTKNLGAMGDGGAILTNDPALAERAKSLRNYGQSALYVHSDIGLNSRLDELQAAILREAILPNLQSWTARRRRIAQTYHGSISNPLIELPRPSPEAEPVWHLFPILIAEAMRDEFRGHLRSLGILTGVHYPHIICDQAALSASNSCQIAAEPLKARYFAAREVSLPIHPFLSDEEIRSVIDACNSWEPVSSKGADPSL
jgi:dTDP-3-amino-3,4,6-trideoxy-alpha-D-glucose transaminase